MARGPPPSDSSSSPEQTPATGPNPNGATPESNREGAISHLSRLMLEGWTMLADTCPRNNCVMPLARSREGRVFCCACQSDIVTTSNQETRSAMPAVTESAAESTPSAVTSTALPNNTVVAVRNNPQSGPPVRREAVSAALGEKLLQGWTMLEQSCTTCATPLLRAVSGTVLCVQCAGTRSGGPSTVSPTPVLGAPPQRAQLPAPRRATEHRVETGAQRARALMPPPVTTQHHRQQPQSAPVMNDGDTFEELCRAEQAAVEALRILRENLGLRRDVEGITTVLSAMREAAATIEALRKARGHVFSV